MQIIRDEKYVMKELAVLVRWRYSGHQHKPKTSCQALRIKRTIQKVTKNSSGLLGLYMYIFACKSITSVVTAYYLVFVFQ